MQISFFLKFVLKFFAQFYSYQMSNFQNKSIISCTYGLNWNKI